MLRINLLYILLAPLPEGVGLLLLLLLEVLVVVWDPPPVNTTDVYIPVLVGMGTVGVVVQVGDGVVTPLHVSQQPLSLLLSE